MNAQDALNEITKSEIRLELGLNFFKTLKKAVLSDLVRTRIETLPFESHQHDEHRYTDWCMAAGDHSDTMLTFLESNLLTMEADEEHSKTEMISKRSGWNCEVLQEKASLSVIPHDFVQDKISQKLVREENVRKVIKPCTDVQRKCCELLHQLSQDLVISDLKISLYITACNNVRVKPFPDHVVHETPDGMLALALINNRIPPAEVLKLLLEKKKLCQLNEDVINLVHWLIVQLRQPKLTALPTDNFHSVFDRVQYAVNLTSPTHMVKIMVNNLSSNYLQWQAAKGQLPTKFAFFGARVEHLHSLVHLGLYPFQKVAGPFGRGIYLTTDLKRCLESSPPSWVWGKSIIGTKLQTIAVVEFIDRSSKVVSYRDKQFVQQPGQGRAFHYFVPDTNLIQARYLLIFVKDKHQFQIALSDSRRKTINKIIIASAMVGGYLSLCYIVWKSLRSTNITFWSTMTDKFRSIKILEHLPNSNRYLSE